MKFSIIKREPSYFFENIHEDLNRFLKDTFGDISYLEQTPEYKMFRPAVELKEDKKDYKLKVELPGINKDDINVELRENSVSIEAQSKTEECKEDENICHTEFRYGKFKRIIPLESPINTQDAKCEFKNGILKINIPKIQEKEEHVKKLKVE